MLQHIFLDFVIGQLKEFKLRNDQVVIKIIIKLIGKSKNDLFKV